MEKKSMKQSKMMRLIIRVGIVVVVACVLAVVIRMLPPIGGEPTAKDKLASLRHERELTTRAEWTAHNATLLPDIRTALENRNWVYAERTIEKYIEFVNDPRLEALQQDFLARKRKAEEQILLVEAENLPGSDTVRNRAVYAKLASLAPDNEEYARRLALYSRRLAQLHADTVEAYFHNKSRTRKDHAEAEAHLKEALSLSPADPHYKALQHRLERDALLFPQGDGQLEIAVEDEGVRDGLRTFYLWVFNVGKETVRLSPEHIILTTASNATLRPAQAEPFAVSLQPDRSVRGEVSFSTTGTPISFAVEHEEGHVVRRFPTSGD